MLVKMEIDTGNYPPIASKPYTLPLKHYDWVQKEIDTLEKAGIIERSISPWASPIVIVPKKSAPGEPPRRRMCVDYRKINKLQPEVTKADGGKGCISLIPLPKNRLTLCKAERLQSFLQFGPQIRILPHRFKGFGKTKISICLIIPRQVPVQQSSIRTSASTSIFPETSQRRTERMQLCDGLFGRHNHLEQIQKRTLRTLGKDIHKAGSSRTET